MWLNKGQDMCGDVQISNIEVTKQSKAIDEIKGQQSLILVVHAHWTPTFYNCIKFRKTHTSIHLEKDTCQWIKVHFI